MFKTCKYSVSIPLTWLLLTTAALAQITPDSTLPNNSVIDNSQPGVDRISEGTTQGNNLFHSFSEFSVLNGRTAFFDNNLNIENIFTRVTGNSISNIDGIIKANGTANLFLLNPAGIIFTENARLNIGGSFIGSTANSLKFSDGTEFSATNPQTQPLLSVNLPTALQFTSNPSEITVEGQGHQQILDETGYILLDLLAEGLEVPTGQTLALIGGNVNLAGGNLKAEAGKVELGGVKSPANVNFTPIDQGWTFSYEGVEKFSDLNFTQAASINTTGNTGGYIRLQGNKIFVQDGSVILTNTYGQGNGGEVNINATELLELSGISPSPEVPYNSSILSETLGDGAAGIITITTPHLSIQDKGSISSNSFSEGKAGNININQAVLVELNNGSALSSQAVGNGNGGDITINTSKLSLQNGTLISTASYSATGKAGNILVNSSDGLVELSSGSALQSNTVGNGNGGDITINTSKLSLQEGAISTSSYYGTGKAGNIIVNSLDGSVELSAQSSLSSGTGYVDPEQQIYVGGGAGGDITIKTSKLSLQEGAISTASYYGTGKAGNINIIVNSNSSDGLVELSSGSALQSSTAGEGAGGDITINNIKKLSLQFSGINTGTYGTGKAGNIIVDSLDGSVDGSVELSNQSGLNSSTAGEGAGGDITINNIKKLSLDQESYISTATYDDSGEGGNIKITVSDSITLAGSSESGTSGIFASSIYGSTGKGGNINLNTNQLEIKEGAQINVSNFTSTDPEGNDPTTVGTGIPGDITITANSLNLDNGQITAKANNENGGNINLNISDISTLDRGTISATAGNELNGGNGGNIDFKSQFIIASGASEITAQAYKGTGGNLKFEAEGLFFSPDTIISVSSKLGPQGTIDIKIPNTNPVEGLIERQNFVYPKQLAVGCNDQVGIAEGSLTYIGKGGIAPLSTDDFSSDTVLDDLRPVPTNNIDENIAVTIPPEKPAYKPIREAQGWRWKDDKKDTVIFISNPIEINPQSSSSNPILCRDLKNHPS